MSESVKHVVREIYSEVIFELAEEAGVIESVMEDLTCVEKVLKAEPEFAILLSLQTIKGQEKSEIIRRVFRGKVNNLTLDFLSVLARRNRMNFLASIADRYEMLVDVYQQRSLIEVTLAKAPDDEQVKRLRENLSKAIDGKVKLAVHIEPAIIAGIIIKKGDRLVDNSVRTILTRAVQTVMEKSRTRIHKSHLTEGGSLN